MRFAASPLLVAVAFGFLGPAALDADDDDAGIEVSRPDSDASDVVDLPAEVTPVELE